MYLNSKRKQKSQRFGYTSGRPSYLHYHAAAPSSFPGHRCSPRRPGSVFITPSSLWLRRRRVGGGARTVGSSSYSVKKREEKGVVERTIISHSRSRPTRPRRVIAVISCSLRVGIKG